VIIPPSPVVRIFRGWKLKQAIPCVWRTDVLPVVDEPMAHAASSITNSFAAGSNLVDSFIAAGETNLMYS